MDLADSVEELGTTMELADGVYASEETLNSSVAFLRNTLAGLGFCQELNLLSNEPEDVVSVCNTIYGLLLQHQKDSKFKDQLKHDLHRMRLELQGADKERLRLETRVAAKEREIGTLMNKQKLGDEQHKEEVRAARREADELQKRLVGTERRVVQFQHEIKRKEKEYERLQERLAHYLADKKKHEKAVVEMAGRLTQQLGSSAPGTSRTGASRVAAAAASDEGLKAVVAAYEGKQAELSKENKDLKASLAALQAEYKDILNRQVRQQQADARSGAAAVEDSFLQRIGSMGEEELRTELSNRIKALQRRVAGLPSCGPTQQQELQTATEQRLFVDLQAAQGVIADQEKLVGAMLTALKTAGRQREAQAQADAKRLAQHYQAQLAAAEAEIQRAQETQAEAAQGEVEALQQQMAELREAVRAKAEAEAAAIQQQADAAVADVRRQLESVQQQLAAAQAEAAQERQLAAQAAEQATAAQAASTAAQAASTAAQKQHEDAAAAAASTVATAVAAAEKQQQEAAAAQQRFELLKSNYEDLMRKYAPGVGAGIFLERAISRKAQELTERQLAAEGLESQGSIPALHA